MIRNLILSFALLLVTHLVLGQSETTSIVQNDKGMKLVVNGENFMINGMNWDYFPIGTNYSYSLWTQPDDMIKAALHTEMSLLQKMGVNAIRQYTGVPPKWIEYIYKEYGIYTMLNHPFGRYGLSIEGNWVAQTNYSDSKTRAVLLAEVEALAEEYKNTTGILMYLLGNENNYGLFWEGAETEDIPIEDSTVNNIPRDMYQLFNEATLLMKSVDSSHLVAMCNGDLQFLDIIAEECQDIDIFGTNVYRGISFGDAFQRVKDELNKPIMFTEFGSDAFNAIENAEDQKSQAYYMVGNWKEIYENTAGLGKAGNSIGGFTFQFSDGWWKFGQTKNLDIHDNNASWTNGGYENDFIKGENNMNEEWFGICAKGTPNTQGLYPLYPRAAYYALQHVHQLNPYSKEVTLQYINDYFANVHLMDAVKKSKENKVVLLLMENIKKLRYNQFKVNYKTSKTGEKTNQTN